MLFLQRAAAPEPATERLAPHIKLHRYQRSCLSWMYTIEQDERQRKYRWLLHMHC